MEIYDIESLFLEKEWQPSYTKWYIYTKIIKGVKYRATVNGVKGELLVIFSIDGQEGVSPIYHTIQDVRMILNDIDKGNTDNLIYKGT